MCGAYGFSVKDAKEVYNRFDIENTLEDFKPRFNARPGQARMGSEQLADIRVMGEFLRHQIHGDARPLDNWLSRQNPWVSNDSFPVKSLIFLHVPIIIAY